MESKVDKQNRINWLKDRISSMEQCRDEMPFGLSEDEGMELAAYKDSLASLTAECKYFQWKWARDENAVWTTTPIEKLSDAVSAFGEDGENVTYRMLFTAPPVPEIKLPSRIENIHLRTPLEVEDMWIDRFKRLNGLGE
ncbi:hypothetical protein AI29_12045 [bacteria symbiont BFo2 of Frankliniella occidentalis]|nr:hypothetical protein AI29_12045 [bacteria symbiont BFo2 of Frankliniella occidentalis]KYP94477.1 hypothetical protein WB60_01135 [bacteria symbiont BFo2 of Frankliniella occidentalis]KYP95328.1 hypothetical protein WB67_06545 [bacteria symbiont BFo2 of Frankliniella occidentalis]